MMQTEQIQKIFAAFCPVENDFESKHLTSGHINQTFLVNNDDKRYILQRINTDIFKNLNDIMGNIETIADHLEEKEYPHQILKPLKFRDEKLLAEERWRLFDFFEDTQTFEKVENAEQAYEAAKFLSEFYSYLADLNTAEIRDSIPGFLDFENRYKAFSESLKNAKEERLKNCEKQIAQIEKNKAILDQWSALLSQIPNRIIHADPKISNFLFKEKSTNDIAALIDWDTFMTGPILYDFGDMVRSYTNLKAEDDPDEDGANFSEENYLALKNGFLFHLEDQLTSDEKENLDLAGKAVIYVQAIRFLTDYLNGDTYYSVKHPEHNLDRTKNQLNLLEELSAI